MIHVFPTPGNTIPIVQGGAFLYLSGGVFLSVVGASNSGGNSWTSSPAMAGPIENAATTAIRETPKIPVTAFFMPSPPLMCRTLSIQSLDQIVRLDQFGVNRH